MPIPTTDAPWAIDDNYPAGAEPEAGTPTKVDPGIADPGKPDIGFRPEEYPPAQYLNFLLYWHWVWIQWLRDQVVGERWVDTSPADGMSMAEANIAPNAGGYFNPVDTSVSGNAFIPVRVPDGTKIDGLRIRVYGDAAGDISASIKRWSDGAATVLGVDLGGGAMIAETDTDAAWTTYSVTFDPHVVDHTNGAIYYMHWLLANHTTNYRIQSIGYRITAED